MRGILDTVGYGGYCTIKFVIRFVFSLEYKIVGTEHFDSSGLEFKVNKCHIGCFMPVRPKA